MIDLTSSKMLTPKINAVIDSAMTERNKKEEPRNYLGGSRIGVECERALQFEFFNTKKDPGKDFSGRILRVFERGHWVESAVIEWMRLAGVTILTEKNGKQFGFSDFNGYFRGHCDGIIVDGPKEFGPFPRLWECKGLQEKYWKALAKHKLRKEKPVYWAQCQEYMHYFDLTKIPALFVAVNMNTMEMYWESVEFCQQSHIQFQEKAKRILLACAYGELLPRISWDKSFYQCKMCDYTERCHGIG